MKLIKWAIADIVELKKGNISSDSFLISNGETSE